MKPFNLPAGTLKTTLLATLVALGVLATAYGPSQGKMLILRGVASEDAPRGQLDEESAVAYARKLGYSGEVLDVAGDNFGDGSQVKLALERIHSDRRVTAIYGFSGGGYNTQLIWAQLTPEQRSRMKKVVVVGSPGVTPSAFPQASEVVVQDDPPEGHMAGPKKLLETARP